MLGMNVNFTNFLKIFDYKFYNAFKIQRRKL